MKKVLCGFFAVCLLVGCVLSGIAESTMGRSYTHVLSGVSDDLDGNLYGWYVGDPNSSVVIIIGLGNEQGAYDDNAVPSYTNSYWMDKNLYWFGAEVNGGSGSIHDGFSKAELDMFAQAHYDNMMAIFPNARVFVVGGYSAGGWSIASMIDIILQNGGTLAAVFGLDCAPKNKLYDAFVNSIGMAHALDVPVFIGSSGVNVTGNRIEARTAKFAKQYSSLISFYSKYDCKHGDLCRTLKLVTDLTTFVDEAINAIVSFEDPMDNDIVEDSVESQTVESLQLASDYVRANNAAVMGNNPIVSTNNDVNVGSVALRSINADEDGKYSFFFNVLSVDCSIIKVCSVVLTTDQIYVLTGSHEIDDAALAACADYYIDVLSSNN